MRKNKIFVACDSANISKIKKIIKETQNSKLKVGYKFGLEFLNSKKGRTFLSRLKNIGFDKNIKKLVLHQARLANKAKLDAIVCSAQEVNLVKKVFKKEIITPGIRFNSKSNDQKRIVTPKQAYKNGSDWLVMGRPITKGNIKKNIQNLIDHLNQ